MKILVFTIAMIAAIYAVQKIDSSSDKSASKRVAVGESERWTAFTQRLNNSGTEREAEPKPNQSAPPIRKKHLKYYQQPQKKPRLNRPADRNIVIQYQTRPPQQTRTRTT